MLEPDACVVDTDVPLTTNSRADDSGVDNLRLLPPT